jgi:hypothetical protein
MVWRNKGSLGAGASGVNAGAEATLLRRRHGETQGFFMGVSASRMLTLRSDLYLRKHLSNCLLRKKAGGYRVHESVHILSI